MYCITFINNKVFETRHRVMYWQESLVFVWTEAVGQDLQIKIWPATADQFEYVLRWLHYWPFRRGMETTCLACLSWVNLPLPDDADSCSKKTFSVVKVARKNRKKPHWAWIVFAVVVLWFFLLIGVPFCSWHVFAGCQRARRGAKARPTTGLNIGPPQKFRGSTTSGFSKKCRKLK